MMTPGSANPLLLADAGYQIQRSLRLRSSASAYFNRTPASAGNRKTWTWSGWVKRGQVGSSQGIIAASGISLGIGYTTGDSSAFITVAGVGVGYTAAQFRDPSAWYHILIKFDTTQATAANRVLFYVNGINQPLNNTLVSQNGDYEINNAVVQQLGVTSVSGSATYLDGYLTDINFIDGQALTPASFGEINPVTGVWSAKKYAGTYGTNGFFLNFSDNSAATAAAIGKDSSGNGNNWTPNNISVTAGVTYDSMLDVPLGAGGVERGNYAVLNPVATASGISVSNANLRLSNATNGNARSNASVGVSSGKWYFEVSDTTAGTFSIVGIGQNSLTATDVGTDALSYGWYLEYAQKVNSGSSSAYGTALTSGDICMVAFDLDNNKIFFGKNGTWFNSSDPAAGTSPAYTVAAGTYNAVARPYGSSTAVMDMNFGQRPFQYTPPAGFKALHTGNLPDPVIKQPAQYMAATTYTGNGTTQSVSNAVNGVSFQPDLVWVKARSSTQWHGLYNSLSGVGKYLVSNSTNAEATYADTLTSFNGGGFSAGNDVSGSGINTSGTAYVGWQWKANGAAVSNTAGSITSQVSAGVSQGFSIVTYTGTGAAATVGHGLGVAPKMVIVKNRSLVTGWPVYQSGQSATPGNNFLMLNETAATGVLSTVWNNTATTSSVFSVGSSALVSGSGNSMVAYCFSEVAGYSKFGSYVGNGSADGPFVYCGFRPRYLMIKRTDAAGNWQIHDTARNTTNDASNRVQANLANAEDASSQPLDVLSNGFKQRTGNVDVNASGGTYIFMAFAEHPFKNSLAR